MTIILAGKEVSNNGLGLMRLTTAGAPLPDEQAFSVLRAALAAGVNCWNGADFYGTPTANSLHLLKRYFTAYPEDVDKVVISIKTGVGDIKKPTIDGSPAEMRRAAAAANAILAGTGKKIDILGVARVDRKVPIEETVRALAALKEEGVIGGIQLSEVGAETIRRAARVAPIDMVEEEVSLWATEIFDSANNGVAATCAELGIPIVAHTPLGCGMLTGKLRSLADLPEGDSRRFFPRFFPENFAKNIELVAEVEKLAAKKGCTPAQLALNWVKLQSRKPGVPPLIPVFGASSPQRIAENTKDIELSEEDFRAIDEILASFPVLGMRYPESAMEFAEY